MQKAERLFQLMTLLRSRRRAITAESLAQLMNVSERTIYRDMQTLTLSGVPIEGEAGVGYRLKPGFSLPPLMFDEQELEALLLGVRMVQAWSDEALGSAADSVLNKIRAVLPDRLHHLHTSREEWLQVPDIYQQQSAPFSADIRASIKHQNKLRIDYTREDGEHSSRTLWPLGLFYWGRTWTLVAWCEERNDYRMFRLDRINTLETLEETFENRADRSLQHYMSMVCPDQ
ncbi:YafY family transcriptional regulator [Pseudomaricurvus alkylphenolicus]|jgi:predicted DNA-binding transcriptional regulator YafY|uniref:helix-turn-helix transcriptional regulator n=1 Tax=Pseudomaricurvus alkylphenolicus TaxID=1306991 RepID=UPI00141E7123|nr:YafY family protein [Pseudomaricurvus alkylphenolicus]NIB42889.1 YafY family transcriptional regulator [Pseudomaricurvus alkylphenolicus]